MSILTDMPQIFIPTVSDPMTGRVMKVHRMPGHYVGEAEPVVDLHIGIHRLTLCAPCAGKIMRCRDIGEIVRAGEPVMEVTDVGTPTWELFIAHRRNDAPGHAGRIGDRLIAYFGRGQVFRDIESLQPGVDFVVDVREKLQRAFAMVVIIGPHWLEGGRIHDQGDLHREEIRTAFERDLHVVPVLVHGAAMPTEGDVPEDIRRLVHRQAIEVTDTRWDYDVGTRLVQDLEHALTRSPARLRFLAQVPPWGDGPRWMWVVDNPRPE